MDVCGLLVGFWYFTGYYVRDSNIWFARKQPNIDGFLPVHFFYLFYFEVHPLPISAFGGWIQRDFICY
jgi:hypothetical protein